MWRIFLRIVLAVAAAGLLALSIILDLYPLPVLSRLPVWAWYALAGAACIALSLTWVRLKPSRWPRYLGSKLAIAILRGLKWLTPRVIQSRTFHYLVSRPFIIGFAFRFFRKIWTTSEHIELPDPQAMETITQIRTMLETRREWPTDGPARELGLALNRTMTWGVAGAALVLLTTVLLEGHPLTDKATLIAAACFAYAIPTLVMCGFILMSHAGAKSSDQGIQPPTLRQGLKVLGRTHTAYMVVCIGMAAMLWSLDWKVSLVFVLSIYWAYRLYKKTITVGAPKSQLTVVPTPPPEPPKDDDKAA
ncbi:MAG TPA: hypothetical protein VFA39_19905 [Steroidobacteraceae bacterium]|nr:hypothetical protein [Steroidobacteraceae bacterium]